MDNDTQEDSANNQRNRIKIIGLTGGIGCGKSTVANLLYHHGCPIIDADLLAREIVSPGSEGLSAIAEAFSNDVIRSDGRLDRRKLREIVYNDASARERLNDITHPRIRHLMFQRVNHFSDMGYQWLIYDAALIVETGLYQYLDALIVVTAPQAIQAKRVALRDNIDEEEAYRVIRAQIPPEEKEKLADYLIDNSGDLAKTEMLVNDLYQKLYERFGELVMH